MEIKIEKQRALLVDGDTALGEIDFPLTAPNQVTITHTFVDPSLRGQGYAEKLLLTLVGELRKRKMKAIPVCPYAKAYFAKHPEVRDVLVSES